MPIELGLMEKKAEEKILVRNTTREERQNIVSNGFAFAFMKGCRKEAEDKRYEEYIEGKKELREVVNEILEEILDEQQ